MKPIEFIKYISERMEMIEEVSHINVENANLNHLVAWIKTAKENDQAVTKLCGEIDVYLKRPSNR